MNSARKTRHHHKLHKPRNPLVAPVLQRKAGAHRKSRESERQTGKRQTERSLHEQ